jgi:CRISPR-associated protein, TM1812 family
MEKGKDVKRVLITSIGGGQDEDKEGNKTLKKYQETVYNLNGKEYEETTYIADVIEKAYNIDKTIIIGTTGSMWDSVYRQYCKKFKKIVNEKYIETLREFERNSDRDTLPEKLDIKIFNDEFKEKVKGIVIKYGLNKEEIFENFDSIIKLQEEFNNTDKYEVYLDITHSFRSTAFWMFLVMNYLTDVSNKNIKIASITYGMHEAKKHKYDKASPVVLLDSFVEILNWIKGASELKQYGNSYSILSYLRDQKIRIELENFSNAMNMNYVASLLNSLDKLEELNEDNTIDSITGPAKHIIPDILKKFIKDFDIKENSPKKRKYLLQATLAKWHFEQKRYAMSAININEAIVSFITFSLKIKEKEEGYDSHNNTKNWLKDVYNLLLEKDNLSNNEKKLFEYAEIYTETRRIRNETAHSIGKENDIFKDIKRLEYYSSNIVDLLKNEEFIQESENKLKLLEKKNDYNIEKEINSKKINNVSSGMKSILILSTKVLTDEQKAELKKKRKWDKIYTLKEDNINRWRFGEKKEIDHLKGVITDVLKKGDYILIHGDFLKMQQIYSYANSKELIPIFLYEKYTPNDTFFKEL